MGVALLAPVPAVLMTSALEIAEREGSVAFGTNAFEFFVKLNEEYGKGLPVLICPTRHYGDPDGLCEGGYANFRAVFEQTRQAWHGKHPSAAMRPTGTVEGEGKDSPWGLYWEVSNLNRATKDERISITSLTAEGKKKPLPLGFVPHGPLLVKAAFL